MLLCVYVYIIELLGTGQNLWEYGTGHWDFLGPKIFDDPVQSELPNLSWPHITILVNNR